jgi:hypothetical protein
LQKLRDGEFWSHTVTDAINTNYPRTIVDVSANLKGKELQMKTTDLMILDEFDVFLRRTPPPDKRALTDIMVDYPTSSTSRDQIPISLPTHDHY